MNRISSGIEGLDRLLDGGYPEGRAYLVAGEPGCGKTIFTLQFLLEGARNGEKGVFITVDEKPQHLIEDAKSLGLDLEKPLKEGLIQILDVTSYFSTLDFSESGIDTKRIIEDIQRFIGQAGARRVAIDPIAPLMFADQSRPEINKYIRDLIFALEEDGCTSLLTSYVPVGSSQVSHHGIEEFAASGIIVLRLEKRDASVVRTLWVRKMRSTQNELSIYGFEIIPERGLVVRQPV